MIVYVSPHAKFSTIFQALALTVLGVSVWAYLSDEGLATLLSYVETEGDLNIFGSATVLLMVIGAVVVLVSFLGCWGAVKVRYKSSNL